MIFSQITVPHLVAGGNATGSIPSSWSRYKFHFQLRQDDFKGEQDAQSVVESILNDLAIPTLSVSITPSLEVSSEGNGWSKVEAWNFLMKLFVPSLPVFSVEYFDACILIDQIIQVECLILQKPTRSTVEHLRNHSMILSTSVSGPGEVQGMCCPYFILSCLFDLVC